VLSELRTALRRHSVFSLPIEVWGHFNLLFDQSVQCAEDSFPSYVLPPANAELVISKQTMIIKYLAKFAPLSVFNGYVGSR
jgi:hypothetical protein